MIELYGYWRSVATLRVRIALNLKALAFEETPVDLNDGAQHDERFLAINPNGAVPALVVDGGPALTQSMAILEYLEETFPIPPLLPVDAPGRARVRAIALLLAADYHPVLTPRVVGRLTEDFQASGAQRAAWVRRWFRDGLVQTEARLMGDAATERFCHGDAPSFADICLVSHAVVGEEFGAERADLPTVSRIVATCCEIAAFAAALPRRQPGRGGALNPRG
jgi:maleylacetoacetate isomerase